MPELRKDPVIERWVIISTERGKRPTDFPSEKNEKSGNPCPFCPGNESSTPPEVLALRKSGSQPNSPEWNLRVIPNKFPALRIEGNLDREGEGIFDKMNGVGAHEVVIETPDHNKDLTDLSIPEIANVIRAFKTRIIDLKKDNRFKHIMVFKNHGDAAGASLEHTHCQMIATPIVPKRIVEEINGATKYYEYKERCIFCDIVRQEIRDKIRVVSENEHFAAVTPFASRFPFEIWIMPKEHHSTFENISDNKSETFAAVLKDVLLRLSKALNNPAYNFMIHSLPSEDSSHAQYHWHLELIPKLTKVAGFEWGTGFYINPTSPEDAAQYLREIKID